MALPNSIANALEHRHNARISTWLTDQEAAILSAVSPLSPQVVHRPSLDMIHHDLRSGTSSTAIISAARTRPKDRAHLAALVADFPHHTIVGVTTPIHPTTATLGAFLLGQSGVRNLVDVTRVGWDGLGHAIGPRAEDDAFWNDPFWVQTTNTLRAFVACATAEYDRFFTALFSPKSLTVRELGGIFGLSANCLIGRFAKAGLPSPKVYLIQARFVSAAWLAETRALTCGDIARYLHMSSPQSWIRTVQAYAGCSFTTFREQYTGASRLAYFCQRFIAPYVQTLQRFDRLLRPYWRNRVTGGTHTGIHISDERE